MGCEHIFPMHNKLQRWSSCLRISRRRCRSSRLCIKHTWPWRLWGLWVQGLDCYWCYAIHFI